MKRSHRARPPVTINREWFGADEFHPKLKRTFLSQLNRLVGRSLALVG